jgi:hypothetical protein
MVNLLIGMEIGELKNPGENRIYYFLIYLLLKEYLII